MRERFLRGDYDYLDVLEKAMNSIMLERLLRVRDEELHRWVADIIAWAQPSSVYVVAGSPEDLEYVRRAAVERGEEIPSRNRLHTVHFDGPRDLARDRANTRILVAGGAEIPLLNTMERVEGVEEIRRLSRGIMRGREMFVSFYCFGPKRSPFTIHAVQVTDSAYVIHSENILYRICYDEFVEKSPGLEYMRFFHSAGERDEMGWSRNIDKRRIYIDLEDYTAYSVNTQYAGNAVGMKKLALRLCVYKGYREGWLCEHMFIAGVRGPNDRITYFTGAFPAGCGKTSTALMSDTIVGDDLAMVRSVNGEARAVNPEIGMFGIIDGVNPVDDPEIYEILTSGETEVVFANVLLTEDGEVWWRGKPSEPRRGVNYAGRWEPGMDRPPSHPNARFTTYLRYLSIADPRMDDPGGVPVGGMIFGGRDSDTLVPVTESFDWVHGIVTMGAALESERTAAVLGKAGVREFNPYAILDFISISVGAFTELHFRFGEKLERHPKIFGVNYFLRDQRGEYLSEKVDKRVWLKWMELRVHNDVDAIEAPTGLIPAYEDLRLLFDKVLGKEYSEELYEKQFTIRVPQHLEKIERIWGIYEQITDTPRLLFETLRAQKERLKKHRGTMGDYISPFKLAKK